MKHLILPLASTTTTVLLILLLTPTTNATDTETTVYDVYSEPLKAGQEYYLVPYSYEDVGGAGGPTWKPPSDHPNCMNYSNLRQVKDNRDFGEPIAFYPTEVGQNTVTLSSTVNIAFTNPAGEFLSSKVWKAETYPDTGIVLGGKRGKEDLYSLFTIEDIKDEDGYKIKVPCSNVTNEPPCGYIGIYALLGERWLGLNATYPGVFMFEPEQIFLQKS